jgi:glycosyltransferase involved in cell wall biosynthesis
MSEKTKVFIISDHPMAPSGVGTQTKYMIEALLKTGRYKFICLGGAIKHPDYQPQKVEGFGDDFIIQPVDGYGTPEMVRSIIWNEKPDILWFMTDPRFFGWLWQIENEIRKNVPMVYYHVWDNYPFPMFNKKFYDSNDVIASISKVTHDIVNNVSPEVENHYLPHAVDPDTFRPRSEEEVTEFKNSMFAEDEDRFTFFWNNRNARRKQSGTLIHWFNEFAEEIGPDKVRLIMHTDPKDVHGQDLVAIMDNIGATDNRILISDQKVPPDALARMYNIADCTINISDAEGFGLATLESLSSGVPIIVNMTGGLQEQVTDGEEWFGIGITPASKSIIGSQEVPYIHEDRLNKEDFLNALRDMYNMAPEERKELGQKGREHVIKNYNFIDFEKKWVELMDNIHEKYGSWENRKGYKAWNFEEVA